MAELVTAVITTYKRKPEIVKRAIESVLAQTYRPMELIVVDDNRAEDSAYSQAVADIAAAANNNSDIPIQLMPTMEGKHGGQPARNTGIKHAKGELIAFLDDDDEWLPDKIKMQVQRLSECPDAGMCYCRGYLINENFEHPPKRDFHMYYFPLEASYKELLRGDCIGTTSQAMIRRSVFENVGGFDEALPARQDYEMWIRIARKYRVVAVDERLFRYYVSKKNASDQVSRNMDKCIEGHKILYQKYKADIDTDKTARFNVIFNLAHYYMLKGDKPSYIKYYIKAFFVSPPDFWRMGIIKLKQMNNHRKYSNDDKKKSKLEK